MRLEIAERLRCTQSHEPAPMVVVASEVDERELVRGTAGCPVCHAEVRISEGDVWFGTPVVGPGTAPASPAAEPDAEALGRMIALLGLAEPEGTVLQYQGNENR